MKVVASVPHRRAISIGRAISITLLLFLTLGVISAVLRLTSGIGPDGFLKFGGLDLVRMDHISSAWWHHVLGPSDRGLSLASAVAVFFALDTALFVPVYGYVLLGVVRHAARSATGSRSYVVQYASYAFGAAVTTLMGVDLVENAAGLLSLARDGARFELFVTGAGALCMASFVWLRDLRGQVLLDEIAESGQTWAHLAQVMRRMLMLGVAVVVAVLISGLWAPMHGVVQRTAGLSHAVKGILLVGVLVALLWQGVHWFFARPLAWRAVVLARADRWSRMILWLLLANAFHIAALVAVPYILKMPQALDALLSMDESAAPHWGTQLLAPMIMAAVLLGVSSQLLGLSLRERIAQRVVDTITPATVARAAVIVVPVAVALGVALSGLIVTGHLVHASGAKQAGLVLLGAAPALVLAVQGTWLLRARRWRVGVAATALIWVAALAGIVVTASNENIALATGPIGIVFAAAAFWGSLVTTAFISVPLLIDWLPASLAWMTVLVLLALRMEDPYRMPRDTPAVSGGAALSSRRYECVERALYTWLKARAPQRHDGRIPVVLIAADGGGIRAGYWAARSLAILDRETQGELSRHTFAYSGVSGGSLGIATFVDAASRHPGDPDAVLREIDAFYAQDLLSPVLGRLLITDPLRFVVNNPNIRGRDEIFEEQLARQWHATTKSDFMGRPMLDALGIEGGGILADPPIVIFNSTIAETGMRLEIGNVSLSGSRGRSFSPITDGSTYPR